MADINFDQFKQEIRVAENYLRAATVRSGSSDSSFSSKVRASADGLVVLDATRKEGILQQFGRRSMVSSLDLPSRLSRRIDDSEDRTVYDRSTFDVASVSTDPFWREGGRSSIPSATDDQAFGRYSSRSEREKLINRLLIDHDSKHREQSSEIVPESNYFNDYHDPVESRRQDVKHNLSQAGAVHSPDSPTTTSDDDNPTSLFFASDIHLSTDFGHRSQVPTFVAAQGTDGDNSYQHESPNVIKVSYSVQDDAFARLTGACADRASYVDKIAVWETSDCNMSDKTPHIRSVLVVPGGNEIYRDNTPGEPVSTSIKNIGNNHFKQEMASEVNVSSKYRYRESSAGGEIIESESVKSDAPVKKTVITKKFHKTKEQLQKEAEATFQKHCAFRPTIQSDDRKSRDRRDMYGTDRIEAMQKSYKKSQEEREKQKKDFLNIELMNCTFQPRITKMGEGTTRTGKVRNTTDSSQFNAVEFLSGGTGYSANEQFQGQRDSGVAGEVSMRLYNDAEQRSTQQQWLERQVVEARLAQFTFQPSINPVTTSYFDTIEYKPIYERVGELQKEREDRRRILKQNYEDAQVDLTFTPAIDPKSRRIAVKKLESEEPQEVSSFSIVTSERDECPPRPAQQTDVGSRLHRQAFSAARRKQELCTKRDELEIMEMEPPRLSKGTEKLALNSFKVGASFQERQAMHAARVQCKTNALQRAADEEGSSWFKPEIGQSTNIIALKRPDQLRETAEERAHRMSHETANGIEERRRKKEQELYGALTFAPEIDPLSRAIGRTRGLQELTENRSGQRVRDIARMTAERIQESECTFRPSINPYSSPYHDSRVVDERRYNTDITPTCWTEGHFSNLTDGHGELEEDIDGDSLNPIGYNKYSAGGSMGLRSGQHNGKRLDHYRTSTVNQQKSCRMADNIRQHQIDREERRRADLVAREIEEMKECTFQPSVANYSTGGPGGANHKATPVLVRGLGRHLELKFLSLKQREEAERREKEVFSVRNIDHFRRVEDGSTIVKPFVFSDMSNRSCSRTVGMDSDLYTYSSAASAGPGSHRGGLGVVQR